MRVVTESNVHLDHDLQDRRGFARTGPEARMFHFHKTPPSYMITTLVFDSSLAAHQNKFYSCDAMLERYLLSLCVRLSLRLSVRPSVISRHCTKTAKRRITRIKSYNSPGSLVLSAKYFAKFQRVRPQRGRQTEVR